MGEAMASASVRRVMDALRDLGAEGQVVELADSARTAQEAADALGTELGSIVKSLVFAIDGKPVMALVAGDRQCCTEALPRALGLDGKKAKRADADLVRRATGFAIGGVAPVGHVESLPVVIDQSLERFATVYAAAGHPHCVFPTTLEELKRMTPGIVAGDVSKIP